MDELSLMDFKDNFSNHLLCVVEGYDNLWNHPYVLWKFVNYNVLGFFRQWKQWVYVQVLGK